MSKFTIILVCFIYSSFLFAFIIVDNKVDSNTELLESFSKCTSDLKLANSQLQIAIEYYQTDPQKEKFELIIESNAQTLAIQAALLKSLGIKCNQISERASDLKIINLQLQTAIECSKKYIEELKKTIEELKKTIKNPSPYHNKTV